MGKEYILGLQIAVGNAVLVAELQGACELPQVLDRATLCVLSMWEDGGGSGGG